MLGVLYQFYYEGGDTFNYFTNGSKWIWEAFRENPVQGIELLFDSGGSNRNLNTFHYNQKAFCQEEMLEEPIF